MVLWCMLIVQLAGAVETVLALDEADSNGEGAIYVNEWMNSKDSGEWAFSSNWQEDEKAKMSGGVKSTKKEKMY